MFGVGFDADIEEGALEPFVSIVEVLDRLGGYFAIDMFN